MLISDITSLNSLLEILTLLWHSPKEGKPGEVDREGDDVEEDAQQVQHEAEQHCLFTLIVVASRVRVNPLSIMKSDLW